MQTSQTSEISQSFVPKDFLCCVICNELATNAVESTCCKNIFCDACTADPNLSDEPCPNCSENSFKISECHLARRLINLLPIECPFNCKTTVARGELNAHKNKCPNRKYPCARIGCNFKGDLKSYKEHIIEKHSEDIVLSFDNEELKKKFYKKGQIDGFYKLNGENHPIKGSFRMESGKLFMNTDDDGGPASWEGAIDMNNLTVKIVKKYVVRSQPILCEGRINESLTEISGWWTTDSLEDGYKLMLKD